MARNKPSCIPEVSLVYPAVLTTWNPAPELSMAIHRMMPSSPQWLEDQYVGIACLPDSVHLQIRVSCSCLSRWNCDLIPAPPLQKGSGFLARLIMYGNDENVRKVLKFGKRKHIQQKKYPLSRLLAGPCTLHVARVSTVLTCPHHSLMFLPGP